MPAISIWRPNALILHEFFPASECDLGRVLAYKLKYVLYRTGRIYIQEVPDDPDGPRDRVYRGELGRVVLAEANRRPQRQSALYAGTVKKIEPMFRAV